MRIVVVALLLYSLLSFSSALRELSFTRMNISMMEEELRELQEENDELMETLARSESDEEIRKLARERLGMLMPGEKLFIFTTDREEPLWGWK